MGRLSSLSGLRTTVVAVGRIGSEHCRLLCDDYVALTRRYAQLQVTVVREAHDRDGTAAKSAEASHLLKAVPAQGSASWTVALDERGKALTSAAFAAWLAERRDRGVRDLCFVVGGSHGLDPSVLRRCDETIRLSDLTLPYKLARVVLLEQLYRAITIVLGVPYHKT